MAEVKSCVKLKDWTGKDGKAVPIYKVELSDSRVGESFGKEIPIGTPDSDITIEESQYGSKFKWNKPANGKAWGGGGSKSTNESFSLSYAKDVAVGLIAKMDKAPKSEDIAKVITGMADTFYNWLESKKK